MKKLFISIRAPLKMHFFRDCSVGSVLESSCIPYTLRFCARHLLALTKKSLFLEVPITLFLLSTGSVMANEYPTDETVHFALSCMDKLGGQTNENLYTCSCRYDGIRERMIYSDYEEGYTYERNKKMPGEKGSSFRDNQRAKKFYEELVKVRAAADANCIVVKHVKLIKPTVVDDQTNKKTEE